MAYTDVWRCKRCDTKPEILMVGKNFYVRCNTCKSEKVDVHANSIDLAVATWNKQNDPTKRGLLESLRGLFRSKKDEG